MTHATEVVGDYHVIPILGPQLPKGWPDVLKGMCNRWARINLMDNEVGWQNIVNAMTQPNSQLFILTRGGDPQGFAVIIITDDNAVVELYVKGRERQEAWDKLESVVEEAAAKERVEKILRVTKRPDKALKERGYTVEAFVYAKAVKGEHNDVSSGMVVDAESTAGVSV